MFGTRKSVIELSFRCRRRHLQGNRNAGQSGAESPAVRFSESFRFAISVALSAQPAAPGSQRPANRRLSRRPRPIWPPSPCSAANVSRFRPGTYNAIKFDLQLNKIGKNGRARAAPEVSPRHGLALRRSGSASAEDPGADFYRQRLRRASVGGVRESEAEGCS